MKTEKKIMFDYQRTHNCEQLRAADLDAEVTLSGWVHRWRDHGGLIFIDLRDRYGLTQLVFDPKINPKIHSEAEKMRSEWVISVKGKVKARAEGMTNPKLSTGEIEVEVFELAVLSQAKTPPFSICDESFVNEEIRLKYRYLDIRRGFIAKNLLMRHQAMMMTRSCLDELGFVEITTPIMGKSTPEGARDYLIPSRIHPGHFYALPQSPQLFKQLLMVAGMDRYFQIATCFRDEDLRAERQPEFTQIDIELSFSNSEELFAIVEKLTAQIFKKCIGLELEPGFRRMTYQESMDKYGSDKPDLRFGMPLIDISDIAKESSFSIFLDQLSQGSIIKGLCVKAGAKISRKGIDDYTSFVAKFGIQGLAWMKMQEGKLSSSIVKFFDEELQKRLIEAFSIEDGDLILMVAQQKDLANQALDHLRRRLAQDLGLIKKDHFEFVWITDFPLFEYSQEEKKMTSTHHPFTAPHPEDFDLLQTDPLKVRSSAYDLVLNGHEIAGGSQRIYQEDLQKQIFKTLDLSVDDIHHKFGFFVEALQYGTPPHQGIAFGFDRLMMSLIGSENIRDVIAFPKTQKATDLMMQAPSLVSQVQLDDLNLDLQKQWVEA